MNLTLVCFISFGSFQLGRFFERRQSDDKLAPRPAVVWPSGKLSPKLPETPTSASSEKPTTTPLDLGETPSEQSTQTTDTDKQAAEPRLPESTRVVLESIDYSALVVHCAGELRSIAPPAMSEEAREGLRRDGLLTEDDLETAKAWVEVPPNVDAFELRNTIQSAVNLLKVLQKIRADWMNSDGSVGPIDEHYWRRVVDDQNYTDEEKKTLLLALAGDPNIPSNFTPRGIFIYKTMTTLDEEIIRTAEDLSQMAESAIGVSLVPGQKDQPPIVAVRW